MATIGMKCKKIIRLTALIFGAIVLLGGVVAGVVGLWPVASVGVTPITYASFRDNVIMADHFYRSNIKIAGESDALINADDTQRDLQRVTMQGLIEYALVDRELGRRYAKADLQKLIDNKIAGVDLESASMKQATNLMYGLTPKQFRELVLVPKARQEILEGGLLLQSGTYGDWLAAQKKAVRVSLFMPGLYWDGSEVRVR